MKIKKLKELNVKDREKKLKELKLELMKSRINSSKKGNSKAKEIKKIIARILMLNDSEKEKLKNK